MALRMSARGRYGVRLMTALALRYEGGTVLLKEIARAEAISEKYLSQIIITLRAAGLVVSQRGSHGGYALARPPQRITVKEVVEAVEGRIAVAPCLEERDAAGPAACARITACAASILWRRLSEDIERSLASFTLDELARQARRLWEQAEPAPDYVI